jgi:hypothetical protein
MTLVQGSPQEIENARIALILAMTSIALFWRALLRMLLVITLVAVCVGAYVLLNSMHP